MTGSAPNRFCYLLTSALEYSTSHGDAVVTRIWVLLLLPPIGERSIVMSLCAFVCRNYTYDLDEIFCACYLWPWLGPPLAA